MNRIPEDVRQEVYNQRGKRCFICGAGPPEPTPAQKMVRGIKSLRMPLHHLTYLGNYADNLIPVCERNKDGGNGCHMKIHRGNGDILHRFFHQRLTDDITEEEAVFMMDFVGQLPNDGTRNDIVEALVAMPHSEVIRALELLGNAPGASETQNPNIGYRSI